MTSHPAFTKFTLPDSPILRDHKERTVELTDLPLNGHRKTISTVQTLKFATGRRPGHHQWYRKRVKLIEIVTYSIYDGDHNELTTDSERTESSSDRSTPPYSSSSGYEPSESSSSDDTEPGAGNTNTQSAMTEADVCTIHARMYADADNWATSALQAIALAANNANTADNEASPATNNETSPAANNEASPAANTAVNTTISKASPAVDNETSPAAVIAQADTSAAPITTSTAVNEDPAPVSTGKRRVLGFTLSTAISVTSSGEESEPEASAVGEDGSKVPQPEVASAPARVFISARAKRGITLQGEPSGPPSKKAKTAAASKAT